MKKILVAATILLGGLMAVNAQNARSGERHHGNHCRPATGCTAPAGTPCDTECAAPDSGQCCGGLFAGIELTQQQQEALQQLRTQCANDRNRNRQDRAAQALENRRQRLAAIKNILTPEQYVQFLENSFLQGGRKFRGADGQHAPRHRGHEGIRAERRTHQGQAPARQLQQQAAQQ